MAMEEYETKFSDQQTWVSDSAIPIAEDGNLRKLPEEERNKEEICQRFFFTRFYLTFIRWHGLPGP